MTALRERMLEGMRIRNFTRHSPTRLRHAAALGRTEMRGSVRPDFPSVSSEPRSGPGQEG